MNKPTLRIVILGGGFGGLYTALRLIQFPWDACEPEIILVDKSDRFLFSPLLYELVTEELRTWEIAPPFEELFAGTGIRFYQACAVGVEPETKQVHLDNGAELSYDCLVIAVGGKTPVEIVPGAKEYALPFRTLKDAYRLKERLRMLDSETKKIRVAIVGAGYSGVELACKLADRLGERGRIRLVERGQEILLTSPEFNRETAQEALQQKQVWIDLETEVEAVTADTISLTYKGQIDTIPVDIVLWTVGTKVSDFVKELPFPHTDRGLLMTNAMLQVEEHSEIYALGDLAEIRDATGQQVPTTAQAALQQSDYCAWNIWASAADRPLLPFRYQHLGELMALGTDSATVSSLGIKFDGTFAYLARRLLYLYRMPTLKHQLNVGLNWIAQPISKLLSHS